MPREINKFISDLLPTGSIPIDISSLERIPHKETVGYYVRGFGFIFAAEAGRGLKEVNIQEFVERPTFELRDDDKFLFLVLHKNGYIKIFSQDGRFKLPYHQLNFDRLASLGNELELIDQDVLRPLRKSIKKDKEKLHRILRQPKIQDIHYLFDIANRLVHGIEAGDNIAEDWSKIALVSRELLGEVFEQMDKELCEKNLDIIARSMAFLGKGERVELLDVLIHILERYKNMPIDLQDKVASLVLVGAGAIESAVVKKLFTRRFETINPSDKVSSNLAKLLRKYV